MEKLILKENESRKEYLIRVAIAMLNRNAFTMEAIEYDEAECDAFCLAEDLRIEFNISE